MPVVVATGDLAARVGVVRVVDPDPRVGGERQPLELLGQLDLVLGGERRQRVVPQVLLGAGDAVGLGQAGPLVDRAERDVVARLGEHLVDGAGVERAGVGEPGAAVADHADADALVLRRRRSARPRPRRPGPRSRRLATRRPRSARRPAPGRRPGRRAPAARGPALTASSPVASSTRSASAAPKPERSSSGQLRILMRRRRRSVSAVTRSVGWPVPTGTPWPSLPHVPGSAHREVVADSVDVAQHLRTVADEVGLPQRLGDLAVLDEVGLGHAEHEVAAGRVDLPPPSWATYTPCSVELTMSSGSLPPSVTKVLVIRTIGRCM